MMVPEKKAAPEGAAKFREETPRTGGGTNNGRLVMPHCSNMNLCQVCGKPKIGPKSAQITVICAIFDRYLRRLSLGQY